MPNVWRIVRIARPLKRWFVVISVMVLLASAISQGVPIVFKFIVDEIENQLVSGDGDLNYLYSLIALSFGLAVMSVFLEAINQRMGDYIASRLRKFLVEEFYQKIFTLPQRYFDGEISGKIVNQLSRGIDSIQQFVNGVSNFMLPALLQVIWTVGILFYFNIWIALLTVAIFPVYMGVSYYSARKWRLKEEKKNALEDMARGRVQEVMNNIKLVKVSNTSQEEWSYVSSKFSGINKLYDSQSTTYHILNFWRNFGLELILAVIAFIVFIETYHGRLSTGDLVLIFQQLNAIRRPLFAMSFIMEAVQRAEAGSKEYFEVLDLPSVEKFEVPSAAKLRKQLVKQPTIEFDKVNFHYGKDDESQGEVLSNVSFSLKKRETVALVGHSGAGKTTIINLILKLYDPVSGQILLGGKDYKDLSHAEVRSHIALVFQEHEIFSSTVRANVAYGVDEVSDEDVIKALKAAHAYGFVKNFHLGLDEEVGERGVKLSGGQKQRLQIARAIMQNAPILILDEATSSLDAKSEKLVQEALDNLTKDKLVIMIAHRFSTLQNADRILVVNDGKIVDQGSPADLARRKGIYSELLQYQIDGNKKLLNEYGLID